MRLIAFSLLFSLSAAAQPVDVTALYEVSTEGTTTKVKAGEAGKVVVAIKLKGGAHVSDEAPLKLELSSQQAKLSKDKLTLADSIGKPEPRFEVPFTAQGATTIDAKMTFFICTEKLCSRQTKQLSLNVEVL